MVGCIEFRRSKAYKNDPLNYFSKKLKFQNNLMISQVGGSIKWITFDFFA